MEERLEWSTKSMGGEAAGKTSIVSSFMKSVCRGKQNNRVVAIGRWRETRQMPGLEPGEPKLFLLLV